MKNKTKSLLLLILKTLVFIFAWSYVLYVLYMDIVIEESTLSMLYSGNKTYLYVTILLLPFNWGLEIIKWRKLIAIVEQISIIQAVKSVLGGICFALITPNRVGEIPGRMFLLKQDNILKGMVVTSVGSILQLIVTLVFGVFSMLFLFQNVVYKDIDNSFIIVVIAVLCIVCLLYIILFPKLLFRRLFKLRIFKKYEKDIDILQTLSYKTIVSVFLLSTVRYFVFVSQFALCILFVGVSVEPHILVPIISVIYLFTTLIPTFALAEFGIRGPVAVSLFALWGGSSVVVFAGALYIWIINLAIPALIGSLFLLQKKSDTLKDAAPN